MSQTLEKLISQLEPAGDSLRETVSVDLTEVLGEGALFVYRAPSLYDLYAVAEPQVISQWRQFDPEMPAALATQLELMARLHIAPPSSEPVGRMYAEIIRRLEPSQAVRVLRLVERAISETFGLSDIAQAVDEKK